MQLENRHLAHDALNLHTLFPVQRRKEKSHFHNLVYHSITCMLLIMISILGLLIPSSICLFPKSQSQHLHVVSELQIPNGLITFHSHGQSQKGK